MWYHERDGGKFWNGKGWVHAPWEHYLINSQTFERIDCDNKKEAIRKLKLLKDDEE